MGLLKGNWVIRPILRNGPTTDATPPSAYGLTLVALGSDRPPHPLNHVRGTVACGGVQGRDKDWRLIPGWTHLPKRSIY